MHRNRLLAGLPKEALAELERYGTHVEFQPRQLLERSRSTSESAFFILAGICEARVRTRMRTSAAVGMVGNEGMIGTCFLCGADSNAFAPEGLIKGEALRVAQHDLLKVLSSIPAAHAHLLRYVHLWLLQVMHTALANAEGNIAQRVARWLLMLQDRQPGVISVTHESIADSLNVRRPGVTAALQDLNRQGIVEGSRGGIQILDRERLIAATGGLYGIPEEEYRRTLPEAA